MIALSPVSSSWQKTTCSCPPLKTALTSLSEVEVSELSDTALTPRDDWWSGEVRSVLPLPTASAWLAADRYRTAPEHRRFEDRPTTVVVPGTVHALRVFGESMRTCAHPKTARFRSRTWPTSGSTSR